MNAETRSEGSMFAIEPVRLSVTVPLPPDGAFELFTTRMETWWPLRTHAIHDQDAAGVVFEAREGGTVYETCPDGRTATWADVLVYRAGERIVLAWKPNTSDDPSTEVEVRFEAIAGGTRVSLEHRGWERLGEKAVEKRAGYDTGWVGVLDRYVAAV